MDMLIGDFWPCEVAYRKTFHQKFPNTQFFGKRILQKNTLYNKKLALKVSGMI